MTAGARAVCCGCLLSLAQIWVVPLGAALQLAARQLWSSSRWAWGRPLSAQLKDWILHPLRLLAIGARGVLAWLRVKQCWTLRGLAALHPHVFFLHCRRHLSAA